MKVKTQKLSEEYFKPFELIITLESIEEVGAIYGIFNHARITDIADAEGIDTYSIRESLIEQHKKIPYQKVHSALMDEFK